MNELEKIKQQEKRLKEKKRAALAREYEKIGRAFMKKSKVKTFESAHNILEHTPIFSSKVQNISDDDYQKLQAFADELLWQENGQYWRINDIKNMTNFLAKFRTKN